MIADVIYGRLACLLLTMVNDGWWILNMSTAFAHKSGKIMLNELSGGYSQHASVGPDEGGAFSDPP